jgi:formamidopyrimidine-DNA glycosylase
MPELPEVEYIRQQLSRAMKGARIAHVTLRRPDLRYPFPPRFAARLQGTRVLAVTRRAKYLVLELSSGDVLLIHLGMSGWFRVHRGYSPPLELHDHVLFQMSSGETVVFNDPRRFGFMKLIDAADGLASPTNQLGPEPLDDTFTPSLLAGALARRSSSLKAALLDQRVVAGLGNIYVSEALHRARLSPRRRARTIVTTHGKATERVTALVHSIKETLHAAIARQHRASATDRCLVYDREGKRCPRRDCRGTIRRVIQAGRSTFFCPVCQR